MDHLLPWQSQLVRLLDTGKIQIGCIVCTSASGRGDFCRMMSKMNNQKYPTLIMGVDKKELKSNIKRINKDKIEVLFIIIQIDNPIELVMKYYSKFKSNIKVIIFIDSYPPVPSMIKKMIKFYNVENQQLSSID